MTASESDVVRIRKALASLADDGGASSMPSERIFDALHGTLNAEERRSVVSALASDPDAAEAWRLARELAPSPASSFRFASRTWMSVAAAIALVVSGAWLVFEARPPLEAPVYRAAEQRTIASRIPAGAALSRTEPVLRWTPLENARYRLRIFAPDLELLAETEELTNTEYRLPPETLRQIPPGGSILWQVDARISGEAGIVSPTFSVAVD